MRLLIKNNVKWNEPIINSKPVLKSEWVEIGLALLRLNFFYCDFYQTDCSTAEKNYSWAHPFLWAAAEFLAPWAFHRFWLKVFEWGPTFSDPCFEPDIPIRGRYRESWITSSASNLGFWNADLEFWILRYLLDKNRMKRIRSRVSNFQVFVSESDLTKNRKIFVLVPPSLASLSLASIYRTWADAATSALSPEALGTR